MNVNIALKPQTTINVIRDHIMVHPKQIILIYTYLCGCRKSRPNVIRSPALCLTSCRFGQLLGAKFVISFAIRLVSLA